MIYKIRGFTGNMQVLYINTDLQNRSEKTSFYIVCHNY